MDSIPSFFIWSVQLIRFIVQVSTINSTDNIGSSRIDLKFNKLLNELRRRI